MIRQDDYLLTEIPYRRGLELFAAVAGRPWAALLDSGGRDRWDVVVAEPVATVVSRRGRTTVARNGEAEEHDGDPFDVLRGALGGTGPEPPEGLPFAGGALGWFAYDLGGPVVRLPMRHPPEVPEMAIGLYDWAAVTDHRSRRSWLVGAGRHPETRERWPEWVRRFSDPDSPAPAVGLSVSGKPSVRPGREEYAAAFEAIRGYLRDGDCYQVNFALRFDVPVTGEGWPAYRRLRELSPVPFGAYLGFPDAEILSASPERFLELRRNRVVTRPIKGTRPRHADPERDAAAVEELRNSTKDRAENVMIVDLLRNDLGKSCVPGSVRVPELFAVESYSNVHHLVSTVEGRLAPEQDALSLLRGCFPGGSITGAPKRRAMGIIDQLEYGPRGVYCGAIGYIGFDGAMDSNIAIRTLTLRQGRAEFHAGGGIVQDSECGAEYAECLDKAAPMLQLLGMAPPE